MGKKKEKNVKSPQKAKLHDTPEKQMPVLPDAIDLSNFFGIMDLPDGLKAQLEMRDQDD